MSFLLSLCNFPLSSATGLTALLEFHIGQEGISENGSFLSVTNWCGVWGPVVVRFGSLHLVTVDFEMSFEDLGMGGFMCLGGGGVQGAVVCMVRFPNEAQSVDDCLYRISRCLNLACTECFITGCYNVFSS